MQRDKREVHFATSNMSKFLEAQSILTEYGMALVLLGRKGPEIQSESIEEIARHSAKCSSSQANVPLAVEDAGLFINSLGGFPGPYSSYVHGTLGCEGILKLMNDTADRKARFVSAVAFCEPTGEPACFTRAARGVIATEARGQAGFGFDPIFIPEGEQRTFGEMSVVEKNRYSHRAKAFREFARWFTGSLKP